MAGYFLCNWFREEGCKGLSTDRRSAAGHLLGRRPVGGRLGEEALPTFFQVLGRNEARPLVGVHLSAVKKRRNYGSFTVETLVGETAGDSDRRRHYTVLALATLGVAT